MSREADGRIARVDEGGPAWNAGIRPGDELLSINGRPVRDVLEFRFHAADEQLRFKIRRGGETRTVAFDRDLDDGLGIEFEKELFDGVRSCRNKCIFCFLRQMPRGLRKSLYVRDDDFRLSFAHGNYISLTNLSDEDMERIKEQRLSPLYVSVHATEPDLRAHMFGHREAARVMDRLRSLAEGRITVHAQIVLCPGINDGEHLERTVSDLSSLHPWVASIAVVPVGLTKFRHGLYPLKAVDTREAKLALAAVSRFQREFGRTLGTRLVFASDELYLLAGKRFPSCQAYEGFPQLEDGVGTSRIFIDELRRVKKIIGGRGIPPGRYALVTGVLAAPMVADLAAALSQAAGVRARGCIVKNRFLGESVTVAGLLAGCDVADELACTDADEQVVIPAIALNDGRFLDDMTVGEMERCAGRTIIVTPPSPIGLLRILTGSETKERTGCRAPQ